MSEQEIAPAETPEPTPAAAPAVEIDLNEETLAAAARALAAGHLSPEDVKRGWQLSDAELEAISKPAPSRQSIKQELREIEQLRKTDPKKYWGPETQAKQLGLIEAQLKADAERSAVPQETGDRLAAIAKELREIDQIRRTNRRQYDADMEARELALLTEREQLKTDSQGLPKELLDEWAATGGVEHNLEAAREVATAVFDEIEEADIAELSDSFDGLPPGAQLQCYRFMATEPASWRPADASSVQKFQEMPEGKELAESWGDAAPKKIAAVQSRIDLMASSMSAHDRAAAERWLYRLPSAQLKAVLRSLAGK